MPRDYKHRRKPADDVTPGWAWGLGGLALGLMVALFVHLQDRRVISANNRPVADAKAIPSSARDEPQLPEEAQDEPRFDFYDMLPRFEVVIPESERAVSDGQVANAQTTAKGTYVLQAGSFQKYQDADRRKAELALLGLESQIQNVTIDDRKWYRVRLGPFSNSTEMRQKRRQLRQAEIDVLVLRIGD